MPPASLPVRHLTSGQLGAVLESKGIELPKTASTPHSVYLELARKHGITDVLLTELSQLRSGPSRNLGEEEISGGRSTTSSVPPRTMPAQKAGLYQSFDARSSSSKPAVPVSGGKSSSSGGGGGGSNKEACSHELYASSRSACGQFDRRRLV